MFVLVPLVFIAEIIENIPGKKVLFPVHKI